jgi:predicted branched-subunit amino acid permease
VQLCKTRILRQAQDARHDTRRESSSPKVSAIELTALGMWEAAGAMPIILTTLVINLRHLLMGASVAPHLRGLHPLWKALLALWISDESYALSMAEY